MGIQMLTGFGGFQSYYKASEIPKVSTEEVKQQEIHKEQQNVSAPEDNYSQQSQVIDDNRLRTADLQNISLTFNKEESYEYIGSESGLANLDMQKAISDMRKDEILQGYQYFVGRSNTLFQSEDGIVIPK